MLDIIIVDLPSQCNETSYTAGMSHSQKSRKGKKLQSSENGMKDRITGSGPDFALNNNAESFSSSRDGGSSVNPLRLTGNNTQKRTQVADYIIRCQLISELIPL